MGENSKIEWTDHTFNCWTGCAKQSPACKGCYAEAWAKRAGRDFSVRVRTSATNWRKPLKWNRAARAAGKSALVFCASLADVFEDHHDILPEWRADLWGLMRATPALTWLLLTKRPENIARMFPFDEDAPRNVMFGATTENQEWYVRRWHYLRPLAAEGWGTFLSVEPMLGPVSIDLACPPAWVIAGGESGGGARPTHPAWVRDLRDQCAAGGIPFLFKQWGEWAAAPEIIRAKGRLFHRFDDGTWMQRNGKKRTGRLIDGVTHLANPFI